MSVGVDAVLASALAEAKDIRTRLRLVRDAIPGRVVFTTSFGLEDQAVAHAIFTGGFAIEVVTLDTGRLFEETYEVWAATEERYGSRIVAYAPERDALEHLVAAQGVNGFRHSIEARHACCGVRKVAPLRLALAGAAGWVTGLRAGQSPNRAGVPLMEVDPGYGLLKVNPLTDWTRPEVERFVAENAVPYNVLHDRGFLSIGCAPCTRAVRVGESERAGRWWWEAEAKKECGLHLRPAGEMPSVLESKEAA